MLPLDPYKIKREEESDEQRGYGTDTALDRSDYDALVGALKRRFGHPEAGTSHSFSSSNSQAVTQPIYMSDTFTGAEREWLDRAEQFEMAADVSKWDELVKFIVSCLQQLKSCFKVFLKMEHSTSEARVLEQVLAALEDKKARLEEKLETEIRKTRNRDTHR
ncbi:hypothetical protein ABVT39_026872 [Epinephelus coioides]